MGFTGAEAMQWKIKYLEAFNKLEAFWNSPEQIMARALRIADKTIASLEQKLQQKDFQIEAQKPKVLFADAVETSKTSILVGELAKIICQNGYQIGQKRLFQWLRENGYLMKATNLPTQRYIEQGLFEIKESTIQTPDGAVRITKTTKVTGKGQIYFVDKFLRGA
jgi:anti-repressor protein